MHCIRRSSFGAKRALDGVYGHLLRRRSPAPLGHGRRSVARATAERTPLLLAQQPLSVARARFIRESM
jgi:hypothetical protein